MRTVSKHTKLWEGLTALFAVLLVIVLIATSICNTYASTINDALGLKDSEFVNDDVDPDADLEYYKSTFGDLTKEENLKEMIKFLQDQNENEMREGAALLYNQNNALPLGKGLKVSTFGNGAKNPVRTDGGASTRVSEDVSINLKDALAKEDIEVNPTIWDALPTTAYTIAGYSIPRGSTTGSWGGAGYNENSIEFYQQQMANVGDYDDAAIIVIGRKGAEGTDNAMSMADNTTGEVISSLSLFENEKQMINLIADSGKFDKVILVLNTGGYAMETYEVEDKVDAILMMGNPGRYGLTGVAEILSGTTNPSGKLVDTYAKNSLSAPAVVNSGTNTPFFSNSGLPSDMEAYEVVRGGAGTFGGKIPANEQVALISIQVENIYIGYRYYETRYADVVTGDGNKNASSGVGASFGASEWKYENEISYPFGYGLSYTTFEQSIESINTDGDDVVVEVKVKNTGSVAGKNAVQVYAQTPYGEYEKENMVEKAGIQLAGYGKTGLLAPGAEETVTVTIDKYLLASYDDNNLKGYYLSSGDYYFAVGSDAHDALNNVLALRGFGVADGMVASTAQDNNAAGNADLARKWTLNSRDEESYMYSETANGTPGTRVTNQFDDCDINYWIEDAATYLSRSDWEGTYPVEQTTVAATDEMLERMGGTENEVLWYETPEGAPSFNEVAANFGNDKGITIASMREIPISEKEAWREFIFQAELEEFALCLGESFSGYPAAGDYIPAAPIGDGTNGGAGGSDVTVGSTTYSAVQYTSKNILTGTFNDDLYAGRGRAMGEEAHLAGKSECFNLGIDLHRTPFGGRNSEYMSECPTLTYLASIPEVKAMQECGVAAAPKHFVGNDQETGRDGVAVFFTEQAFREGSLRGGEGALRVANAGGIMQSFERLGTDFASLDTAMNTNVLRTEWGWDGNIITDAVPIESGDTWGNGYRSHSIEMLASGTNAFCLDFAGEHAPKALEWAREHNDGYILEKLIDSVIHHAYVVSRTVPTNGISGSGHMEYYRVWWEDALLAAAIVCGVLAAAGAVLLVIGKVKEED